MKKILASLLFLVSIAAFSYAETGVGVEIMGDGLQNGTGGSWGPWVTMKFDGLPYIGVGLNISETTLNLGVTADWHLINEKLASALSFYFGLGGYGRLYLSDNYTDFAASLRAPLGLQIWPAKFCDIFLEIAPNLGMSFNPVYFPDWGLSGAAGVRFWF